MAVRFEINIVDVVALVFSGVAIVLAIKNRKNALREKIYGQQVNFFKELMPLIIEIEDTVDDWFMAYVQKDNEEEYSYRLKFLDKIIELSTLKSVNAIFIPDEMDNEFSAFSKVCQSMKTKILNQEMKYDDITMFGDSIFNLEDSIRDHIGLEKLSRENRRLVS